jgi:hypothetical protein
MENKVKRERSRSLVNLNILNESKKDVQFFRKEGSSFDLTIPSNIQADVDKKRAFDFKSFKTSCKTTDDIIKDSPQFILTKAQQDGRAVKLLTKERTILLEKIKTYRRMIHSLTNSMKEHCKEERNYWFGKDDVYFDEVITPKTVKSLVDKHEKLFLRYFYAFNERSHYQEQCTILELQLTELKKEKNELQQKVLSIDKKVRSECMDRAIELEKSYLDQKNALALEILVLRRQLIAVKDEAFLQGCRAQKCDDEKELEKKSKEITKLEFELHKSTNSTVFYQKVNDTKDQTIKILRWRLWGILGILIVSAVFHIAYGNSLK